jgi:hypothetical protein
MSGEAAQPRRLKNAQTAVRHRLGRTAKMCLAVVRRPKPLAVFGVVLVVYLFGFLWMMQDVFIETSAGFSWSMPIDDPFSRMFQQTTGPFAYERIAFVELGVITWLFSPLNTLIGLFLSILVGLNLALTYLAVTQPKSCGIGAGSGILASIPALLAGSTCCAPVILLIFGIQASGALLTAFTWMLPAGVVLLLGSLVYVAGKVDPTVM